MLGRWELNPHVTNYPFNCLSDRGNTSQYCVSGRSRTYILQFNRLSFYHYCTTETDFLHKVPNFSPLCKNNFREGCGIRTHVSFLTVLQTVPFNHSGNPSEIPTCQRSSYSLHNLQRLCFVFITCKSYIFEPRIGFEPMLPEYHTDVLPLNYPDICKEQKNPNLAIRVLLILVLKITNQCL